LGHRTPNPIRSHLYISVSNPIALFCHTRCSETLRTGSLCGLPFSVRRKPPTNAIILTTPSLERQLPLPNQLRLWALELPPIASTKPPRSLLSIQKTKTARNTMPTDRIKINDVERDPSWTWRDLGTDITREFCPLAAKSWARLDCPRHFSTAPAKGTNLYGN
jgi:hypothetical protein